MRLVLLALSALLLVPFGLLAQSQRYSFQGVELYSDLSVLPSQFKSDCFTTQDRKLTMCAARTKIGSVDAIVDFIYASGKLTDVEVYFPREHFHLIWAALRERWGAEASKDEKLVIWQGNLDQRLGLHLDNIVLHRQWTMTKEMATYLAQGVEYSRLRYTTSQLSADETRRKTRDAAKGL